MKIKRSTTPRGFALREFDDHYGNTCSLQKSSLATADAIWFGIDGVQAKVMAVDAAAVGVLTHSKTGWVNYPIPPQVQVVTRMHLTRAQVKQLLPLLQKFVDTGEL